MLLEYQEPMDVLELMEFQEKMDKDSVFQAKEDHQ